MQHGTVAKQASPAEATAPAGEQMVAPGMLLTHYSPDIPSFLLHSSPAGTASPAAAPAASPAAAPASTFELSRAVVIDIGGELSSLAPRAHAYRDLSPAADHAEAAREVFSALRWAEQQREAGAALVVLPRLRAAGAGGGGGAEFEPALADRLYRAASGREIELAADGAQLIVRGDAEGSAE